MPDRHCTSSFASTPLAPSKRKRQQAQPTKITRRFFTLLAFCSAVFHLFPLLLISETCKTSLPSFLLPGAAAVPAAQGGPALVGRGAHGPQRGAHGLNQLQSRLGPPVPFSPLFWGGFPYQNRLQQKVGILILTSLLEDLVDFVARIRRALLPPFRKRMGRGERVETARMAPPQLSKIPVAAGMPGMWPVQQI